MATQNALQFSQPELLHLFDGDVSKIDDENEPTVPSNILDLPSAWRQRYTDLQLLSYEYHEVLMRFAIAVARREGDTAGHIARMGLLSAHLALAFKADRDFADLIRFASPLHDIGKIDLPDAIIGKQEALTGEEWEAIRRHPQIGAQMLDAANVPLLRLAAEIALSHHEKFDGSGYPQGLARTAIPLSGRIVAVIDFFDALTNDRIYRNALPDAEVLDMIVAESGKHFDPDIIRAFLGVKDSLIAERDRINAQDVHLDELVRR